MTIPVKLLTKGLACPVPVFLALHNTIFMFSEQRQHQKKLQFMFHSRGFSRSIFEAVGEEDREKRTWWYPRLTNESNGGITVTWRIHFSGWKKCNAFCNRQGTFNKTWEEKERERERRSVCFSPPISSPEGVKDGCRAEKAMLQHSTCKLLECTIL